MSDVPYKYRWSLATIRFKHVFCYIRITINTRSDYRTESLANRIIRKKTNEILFKTYSFDSISVDLISFRNDVSVYGFSPRLHVLFDCDYTKEKHDWIEFSPLRLIWLVTTMIRVFRLFVWHSYAFLSIPPPLGL